MLDQKIRFIGGGNMAQSLVAGLLNDNYATNNISISEPQSKTRQDIRARFSVATYENNNDNLSECSVIVLCIKPQVAHKAISDLKIDKNALIISIMAGISTVNIKNFNPNIGTVIRAMPNTPALIGAGATGLYAPDVATSTQKNFTESILRAVGITVWVKKEQQIDMITAVSGSGPAYFFLFVELLIKSAVDLGLNQEQAQLLVLQTAAGSAKMLLESNLQPNVLRQQVTSKGGTTQAAIKCFADNNFDKIINDAVLCAYKKAQKMNKNLSIEFK
jgi:pyrroline-5-carboxylate reductase